MNRFIRYLLFFLFGIVTFYYAWSQGDRRVGDKEYGRVSALTPQLVARSIGYDHSAGNVVAVQAFMNVLDYSSSERFSGKLDSYLLEAKRRGFLKDNTIILFPEHIGSGLVLLGEKKSVYAVNSVLAAFKQIALGDLVGYLITFLSTSHKNSAEIIFKMKSEEMKKVYTDTFRKLSISYGVTIVAGSILLPQPEINPESNEIYLRNGNIYNASFIFLPDGKIYPKLGLKQNLSTTEKQIASSQGNENAFLHFNNVGVVLSNDSLYHSIYADKSKDKEIILSPGVIIEKDMIDWNTADIYGEKETPPSGLTSAELWRKYSIFEKTKLSQTNKIVIQVVMLGHFFDLTFEGETAATIRYVATEGLDNKIPSILNVWF